MMNAAQRSVLILGGTLVLARVMMAVLFHPDSDLDSAAIMRWREWKALGILINAVLIGLMYFAFRDKKDNDSN